MALAGSKRGTRSSPASTTTRTPSMVRLVSAILVASTTLRLPAGAGSMAARWAAKSNSPCNGQSKMSVRSLNACCNCSCTRRISAWPGRNTNTLPDSSLSACSTVVTARGSIKSPGIKGRLQCICTSNIRPALLTTGALPSKADRRSPSRVADINRIFTGASSPANNSRPFRHSARAKSASKLRS